MTMANRTFVLSASGEEAEAKSPIAAARFFFERMGVREAIFDIQEIKEDVQTKPRRYKGVLQPGVRRTIVSVVAVAVPKSKINVVPPTPPPPLMPKKVVPPRATVVTKRS